MYAPTQHFSRRRAHSVSGWALGTLLLLLSVAWPLAGPQAYAQEAMAVEAVSVRGATRFQTRVDLYLRVPYNTLRFLRTADGFAAQYTLAVEAYRLGVDGDRQFLAGRQIWERTVTAAGFGATRSAQRHDRWARSLQLRPGAYEVVLRLEDPLSQPLAQRTIPVEVRDVSLPVAVSDLVVLDDFDAATSTITPRIDADVSADAGSLALFYELYAESSRRVRVVHEVVRTPKSDGVPMLAALLRSGRDDEDEVGNEAAYTQVRPRELQPGRTPSVVTLPIADAEVGEYLVRVRVEDLDGDVVATTEKRVTLRWTGLMDHMRNIDDAVDQLRYIAKERDLERIRDGETEEERLRRLRAFWAKRDPTPGTDRNERMEEYYYRIARANQAYEEGAGRLVAGWETDRGHVLVLFGRPDAVERHPQSASARPYEVWHYERIGRQFIFVDQGQGEYKLLEPVWDEPSRIR